MAAVPAAQPRAGSVASGFYEIWILTAFPGTAEYSALPVHVLRSGAHVGSGFHQVAFHFVGSGDLHSGRRLIDPSKDRPTDSNVHFVRVPAGIYNCVNSCFGKAFYSASYCVLVRKRAGGYIHVGGVQSVLKLP